LLLLLLLQVLCYEDSRLMKLFKDIVKLFYNAGEGACVGFVWREMIMQVGDSITRLKGRGRR
jgi:hypothetical protein